MEATAVAIFTFVPVGKEAQVGKMESSPLTGIGIRIYSGDYAVYA